jgi:hypothetical protein
MFYSDKSIDLIFFFLNKSLCFYKEKENCKVVEKLKSIILLFDFVYIELGGWLACCSAHTYY